jgi:hypothetical protein
MIEGAQKEDADQDMAVLNECDRLCEKADDLWTAIGLMVARRVSDEGRIRELTFAVLDAADAMSPLPDHPDWRAAQ